MPRHESQRGERHELPPDRRPHAKVVFGRVRFLKGHTRRYPTHSSEPNLQCGANAPLGVRADVICLISEHRGDVTLRASGGDEDAKVLRSMRGRVGGDEQADDDEDAAERDPGSAQPRAVGHVGDAESDGYGGDEGRRAKQLGFGDRVSHPPEDDREEVG